jgi:hypothetical protein
MTRMEGDRLSKLIISYKPSGRKLQDVEKDLSLRSRNRLWPHPCMQKNNNLYNTNWNRKMRMYVEYVRTWRELYHTDLSCGFVFSESLLCPSIGSNQ